MDEDLEAIIIGGGNDEDIEAAILINILRDEQDGNAQQQRFNLEEVSNEDCKFLFRFEKDDIYRLYQALRIPGFVSTYNQNKVTGITGLCLLLRRLAYPNRLRDLQQVFGYSPQAMSLIINRITDIIIQNHGHLLTYIPQLQWLNRQRLRLYAQVPIRKPTLATIPTPIVPLSCPDLVKSSTKLPSPCRTCGRPDLPERFHSHPVTPMKPSKSRPRNINRVLGSLPMEVEKTEKVPVKSIVQKPIAIKYKSKNGSAASETRKASSPLKKSSNSVSALPIPVVSKPSIASTKAKPPSVRVSSPNSDKESTMGRKSITPLRGGSGKRTLTCYICGREFGTASLALHEPKCLQKWERENRNLPANLRLPRPVKPDENISQKERDQLAWESSQATLVPCGNCGRTFYPDRLEVHQRSCKVQLNNTKKSSSNDTLFSNSSSPMSHSSDSPSTSTPKGHQPPPSVECYICGRMFGTHSIKIHEKQCLKKWHTENESLPHDMRSPAPLRLAKNQPRQALQSPEESSRSSATPSPKSSKDERPTSGTKSPLFPCYLCGKLFTVNSIYIHEPQCLKMWKIENDKLPASKRRPVPLKPDIKFTQSGKLNFQETSEAYWQSHISQLVACKMCSRTFNPDRVTVHERSCKGN